MKLHGCSSASLRIAHLARAHLRFSRPEDIERILCLLTPYFADPLILHQGLSELMMNAIEHGNLGISYAQKTHLLDTGTWHEEVERRLALPTHHSKYATLDYTAQHGAHILTIRDHGAGFHWQPYLTFSPECIGDPNGRGIAIAASLPLWHITYHGTGNIVRCRIPR